MTSMLNRCNALVGLAIIPAASTVAMAASAYATVEDQLFFDFWDKFQLVHAAFIEAHHAKEMARAHYDAIAPSIPPELILGAEERGIYVGEPESDVEGQYVYPPGPPHKPARRIIGSRSLEIDVLDYGGRTSIARDARRRLKIAREFEAAKGRAAEIAGIMPALEQRYEALRDMEKLCGGIFNVPARTTAGIGIKATVLSAYAVVGEEEKMRAALGWGIMLAENAAVVLAVI